MAKWISSHFGIAFQVQLPFNFPAHFWEPHAKIYKWVPRGFRTSRPFVGTYGTSKPPRRAFFFAVRGTRCWKEMGFVRDIRNRATACNRRAEIEMLLGCLWGPKKAPAKKQRFQKHGSCVRAKRGKPHFWLEKSAANLPSNFCGGSPYSLKGSSGSHHGSIYIRWVRPIGICIQCFLCVAGMARELQSIYKGHPIGVAPQQ